MLVCDAFFCISGRSHRENLAKRDLILQKVACLITKPLPHQHKNCLNLIKSIKGFVTELI